MISSKVIIALFFLCFLGKIEEKPGKEDDYDRCL